MVAFISHELCDNLGISGNFCTSLYLHNDAIKCRKLPIHAMLTRLHFLISSPTIIYP